MQVSSHRTRSNTAMRLLFAAIVALIVHGSFFPWHFQARQLGANPLWILLHAWPEEITRSIIRDIGVNVGVYVPLGVSGWLAFAQVRSRWTRIAIPILIAAGLSVSVECLQLFQETRTCSMADVICNFTGAAAGVALMASIGVRVPLAWIRYLSERADVLLVASGWLLWQVFPLFPIWRWNLLAAKLHSLTSWNGGSGALLTAFTGWLIFACLFKSLQIEHSARWMAAGAAVLLPLRGIVLHGRFVGLPEIAGTLLALAVWQFALRHRMNRIQITVLVTLAYLCVRQLAPFSWSTGAEDFVWAPFTASLRGDSLTDFSMLIEKSFFYSAAVWILASSGVTLGRSAVIVVGLLAATEALQTGIAGRVPESTDAFIALSASVVFWIAKTGVVDVEPASCSAAFHPR